MMGRRVLGLVAALAAIAAACSSFSSNATPPGADDAGTPDDAGQGTPDDASPPVVDASRTFCSDVDAQFCWSFDEGTEPLLGPVLRLEANPAPTLSDVAKSPPGALEAQLDGGGTSMAVFDVGKPVSRIACELDVRVSPGPDGATGGAVFARFDPFNYYPLISADRDNTGHVALSLQGFYNGSATVGLGNIVVDEWTHLRLEYFSIGGGRFQGKGQVGTAPEQTTAINATDAGDGGDGGDLIKNLSSVGFGAFSFNATWDVRVDNIVCRWQ